MKKILKSRLINISLLLVYINSVHAQPRVDTADVIITAADQYFFWKGYGDNLNDTTRLLKSVIGNLNPIADSIIRSKQKEDNVVYSDELIQFYKSNFFSLATVSKLAGSNLYNVEKLTVTFDNYIDKNNTFSVVQWYANSFGNSNLFVSGLYEINKDRNMGAGWNTANQNSIEAFERSMKFMGMQSGKSVTVNCGSGGQVFYDGYYGGKSGVELILFKGSHRIEIKESGAIRCNHNLLIAQNDDGAPIVVTCNNPANPCKCK